jgi:hypothetical protein
MAERRERARTSENVKSGLIRATPGLAVMTVGRLPGSSPAARAARKVDAAPSSVAVLRRSPKAMDIMETPIVNELSRMSAHPAPDLPPAGFRGPQTWRRVRTPRAARTDRQPYRGATDGAFTGGRS